MKNEVQEIDIIPEYPYTIDRVASIIGVHRDTVKVWYQEGKLGYVKFGYKTVRILGRDLLAFINGHREEPNFVPRVNMKERRMKEVDKDDNGKN